MGYCGDYVFNLILTHKQTLIKLERWIILYNAIAKLLINFLPTNKILVPSLRRQILNLDYMFGKVVLNTSINSGNSNQYTLIKPINV